MKKLLSILFFITPLTAAGPLHHLVVGHAYLQQCKGTNELEERAFLQGNLFPDIRYVGNVNRDETHEFGLKLEDIIRSASPFRAGMRLHSFVDEERENIVVQRRMYEKLPAGGGHPTTLLKLIEEEILCDLFDAGRFIPFFSEVSEDEINSGIPVEAHQKWHFFIMSFLAERPSKILQALAAQQQPFLNIPASTVQLWSVWIPQLAQQEDFRGYVADLLQFYSSAFEKQTCSLPSLKPIQVLQTTETADCFISLIEDAEGKRSIVKQIKNEDPEEQFLLALDALACSIGKEQRIGVNKVTIIPPGIPFPGKTYAERPATLHSLAPGKSAEEELPWEDFDIHQRMGKWGPPLSPEEKGLAQTVIRHMSLHAALPAIVALDTFTGNADRSNPNIFYNKEAHAFCGIDMAGAFNSLLAVPAVFQLTRVLNGDIYLGPKEIFALGQYRLTLNFLIENYPPEKLYEMLENYARQAGLMESAKNRIAHHKRIIQQNYQDCRALLYLMNSPEFLDLLDRRE